MTIEQLISHRFKTNQSIHRILNERSSSGFLGCGFVKKNRNWGSNYKFKQPSYNGVWVLSGTGTYEDAQTGTTPLKTGDFVQRLPNNEHTTIVTSDDWMELYIVIGGDLYQLLQSMDVLSQNRPVLSPGLDYQLLVEMIAFFDDLNCAGPLELPLLVPKAISILTRAHYLDKKHQLTTDETVILEMSRHYITKNIKQRLTVEDAANYVNMGYEKFRKMFTNHYGISPGYYMQQHRIHQAQVLLGEAELTIKEIAAELGYTDAYTFSKQFKKLTGLSPKAFKNQYL